MARKPSPYRGHFRAFAFWSDVRRDTATSSLGLDQHFANAISGVDQKKGVFFPRKQFLERSCVQRRTKFPEDTHEARHVGAPEDHGAGHGGALVVALATHPELQSRVGQKTDRGRLAEHEVLPVARVRGHGNERQDLGPMSFTGKATFFRPVTYAGASFPILAIRRIDVDRGKIPVLFQSVLFGRTARDPCLYERMLVGAGSSSILPRKKSKTASAYLGGVHQSLHFCPMLVLPAVMALLSACHPRGTYPPICLA